MSAIASNISKIKCWKGKDIFILGGGPSIKSFDIALLQDKKVIGCNDAYLFGEHIVDICIFGDSNWFNHHRGTLNSFKNLKITNSEDIHHDKPFENLIKFPRATNGFHHDALGWNGNTGASAINLALLLKPKRIFLLGFDMQLVNGKSNWHINTLDNPTEEDHYRKYTQALDRCSWEESFPYTEEIINLNTESKLNKFPKLSWEDVFGG